MAEVESSASVTVPESVNSEIQEKGNLPLAIISGLVAALVAALGWAVITVVLESELGLVAVLVGYAVGKTVQSVGKGSTPAFSVVGAVLALLGCVLGNVLSVLVFFAKAKGFSASDVLSILSPDLIQRLMTATFDPMDLLFYGIAIYEGYRFSVLRAVARPSP